ncbi:MAG: purine-binding chemotaxis protein CheW [Planctomycetaceae bacterium]|nr:purine-binding chemotaxis protein CheW [Planctomycetaceae bacterium]
MGCMRQFCTFSLGELSFGVDVRSIQEVILHHEMTRVPTAAPVVRGLINLRGQIVMAIDPRRRLGLPPGRSEAESINVILRTEDRPVSLLVDAVGDILDLGEEQMEPPPETVRGEIRGLILGIYKLPDRLLLILDTERMADFDAATESAA